MALFFLSCSLFNRALVLVTPARTKQPVKLVLHPKDIVVCVPLDSRVRAVNMVRARYC